MSDEGLKALIGKAAAGPLSGEDAARAFGVIMDGDATAAQIGGFLMALRTRGESVEEFSAAAAAMRARCNAVAAPEGPWTSWAPAATGAGRSTSLPQPLW